MMFWFNVFLVVVSVLLTAAILLQQKGGELSSSFGGSGGVYHSKRGIEKTLFIASIVLSVLFIGGAFVRLLI